MRVKFWKPSQWDMSMRHNMYINYVSSLKKWVKNAKNSFYTHSMDRQSTYENYFGRWVFSHFLPVRFWEKHGFLCKIQWMEVKIFENGIFLSRSLTTPPTPTTHHTHSHTHNKLSYTKKMATIKKFFFPSPSVRVTPPIRPRRFDTYFYVTGLPEDAIVPNASHDTHESSRLVWMSPQQVIIAVSR